MNNFNEISGNLGKTSKQNVELEELRRQEKNVSLSNIDQFETVQITFLIESSKNENRMETKPWIEVENGIMKIQNKVKISQEQIDEFIDYFDSSIKEIEKKAGLRLIQKREMIRLLSLGVILPSVDVWTDVYLAVRLHMAGHER